MSPVEKSELEQRAERAGLNLSEYIRRKSLGRKVKTMVDGKALKELHRIGVNLNQIAVVANRGQLEEVEKQARSTMEELRELIEQIES